MTKHIIGFPHIFDNRFVIDRVAFDLKDIFGLEKSFPIYWYALIIVFAMIVAYVYFTTRSKRTEGIKEDDTANMVLIMLPLGIVGARLFYVLTNLHLYDSFGSVFTDMRNGGLAIYGGILFGLGSVLVYTKIKKLNPFKTLDALAPAVMLAQAIGRWGNFFNAEAYGKTEGIKDFFFRMDIAEYDAPYVINSVHPTFFYESVWNIIGFIVANILYKKKKFNGQIFCFYVFWYGIGRGFIELLRTDSCMIFKDIIKNDPLDFFNTASGNGTGLKAFVYLSILLVIGSIVLYVFLRNKDKNIDKDLDELKAILTEGKESTSEPNENPNSVSSDGSADATNSDAENNAEAEDNAENNVEADDGTEDNAEAENNIEAEDNAEAENNIEAEDNAEAEDDAGKSKN